MNTRTFARIFGIVFLLVGIAGFIPGLAQPHNHDGLALESGSGMLFGLFPVNALHNIIHIAFGIWGLVAARAFSAARLYARTVAIVYGLLVVLGLIPATNDTFGLVPIGGNDIWLHALLAAIAAYFGFVHRDAEADRLTDESHAARV
jgi:hypothetical protein